MEDITMTEGLISSTVGLGQMMQYIFALLLCYSVLAYCRAYYPCWFKSPNGHDVTKRATGLHVNSIVSGRNYDILTSIIAQLLTSGSFGGLSPIVVDIGPIVCL